MKEIQFIKNKPKPWFTRSLCDVIVCASRNFVPKVDKKMHAFNYQIIYNILPIRHKGLIPICKFCANRNRPGRFGDRKHIFLDCLVAKSTWQYIQDKISNTLFTEPLETLNFDAEFPF